MVARKVATEITETEEELKKRLAPPAPRLKKIREILAKNPAPESTARLRKSRVQKIQFSARVVKEKAFQINGLIRNKLEASILETILELSATASSRTEQIKIITELHKSAEHIATHFDSQNVVVMMSPHLDALLSLAHSCITSTEIRDGRVTSHEDGTNPWIELRSRISRDASSLAKISAELLAAYSCCKSSTGAPFETVINTYFPAFSYEIANVLSEVGWNHKELARQIWNEYFPIHKIGSLGAAKKIISKFGKSAKPRSAKPKSAKP